MTFGFIATSANQFATSANPSCIPFPATLPPVNGTFSDGRGYIKEEDITHGGVAITVLRRPAGSILGQAFL